MSLHFAVYAKQLGAGLDEQLEKFIRDHPDTRLIIIDTLQKIREVSTDTYSYPSECRLIDDDENGCLTFEVSKGRFGFKLTAPYDENRRKAASELAKKNTERLRRQSRIDSHVLYHTTMAANS